ncbi:Rhomboid-related protein 2 [Nymphon striatum]|nr:Rhomboid-related protein 2 [Nymphon striatum]
MASSSTKQSQHRRVKSLRRTLTGSSQMDEEEMIEMQQYDTDKDGSIPLDDFKQVVNKTKLSEDFPPEVLDEIIERADWDNNRMLNFEEFLRMVHAYDLGSARPRFQRLVKFAASTVVSRKYRASTVRKYMEEYSCMPPPFFLLLISIVELSIFIYYCVKFDEFSAGGPVPIKSVLIFNPNKRNEAWRFITYMFIHAGYIHIFANVGIQLVLGLPLEMVHKWWRVGLVYFAGVLAGSLGSSIADPKTYLAGASGGVYAILTAHIANVVMNYKEMDFGIYRLVAFIVIIGVDTGTAIYYRYSGSGEQSVSYAAHLAGAIAGLLVGINVLRNLKVRTWETKLWWISLVTFILLMLGLIVWNAAFPKYFPEQM